MFKPPKGTRDSIPGDEKLRQMLIKECEEQFILYDAVRMDTPTFELLDTLLEKYNNDENAKEIFILESKKESGKKCGLRYDLTVPFSRYVKTNRITKMRRYQIGKSFRKDKIAEGRYREFYQCDYDCLGDNIDWITDAETLILLSNILDIFVQKYNLPDFVIKVSSREILADMMAACEIPMELFSTTCSSIDKLDKYTWNYVSDELKNKGLTDTNIKKLNNILFDNQNDKNKKLDFVNKNTRDKMEKMFKLLDNRNIILDLKIARGLDYYTGIIFEVALSNITFGLNSNISIAGGGRYDKLCSAPCVGFSIGIDRILNYVSYNFENSTSVCVISMRSFKNDDDLLLYKFDIVRKLRDKGISVGTEMKTCNSNKLISAALKKNIKYIIFLDDNNLTEKTLTIEVDKKKTTGSFEKIVSIISNIQNNM